MGSEAGWASAEAEPGHPLAAIHGKSVGGYLLRLCLGPPNRVGARYFRAFLMDAHGHHSLEHVLAGLFNVGAFPGHNWVEVMALADRLAFEGGCSESLEIAAGPRKEMLAWLAGLLPPGGHMSIEYESPQWQETELALRLGVPPAATELGELLWEIGCGYGFKNWDFAEGWSEGPRKLQGNKALHPEHARAGASRLAQELGEFMLKPVPRGQEAVFGRARRRAAAVLGSIHPGSR